MDIHCMVSVTRGHQRLSSQSAVVTLLEGGELLVKGGGFR